MTAKHEKTSSGKQNLFKTASSITQVLTPLRPLRHNATVSPRERPADTALNGPEFCVIHPEQVSEVGTLGSKKMKLCLQYFLLPVGQ